MKIGNFNFFFIKKVELLYHAIEFNPEKIEKDTKSLNNLLQNGWHLSSSYQTENGLVHELWRKAK